MNKNFEAKNMDRFPMTGQSIFSLARMVLKYQAKTVPAIGYPTGMKLIGLRGKVLADFHTTAEMLRWLHDRHPKRVEQWLLSRFGKTWQEVSRSNVIDFSSRKQKARSTVRPGLNKKC
jgi:hypothetical protein